jgi:hypothetical protein
LPKVYPIRIFKKKVSILFDPITHPEKIMAQKLGLTKSLVLGISPFVASFGIAAAPSLAATLASSSSIVNITFSQPAEDNFDVASTTDSFIFAKPNSTVTAIPDAFAFFDNNAQLPKAINRSESFAEGQGTDYLGLAQSQSSIVANFSVLKDQSFSFNFIGALRLFTEIDRPPAESARANGEISLLLFETTDTGETKLLDFFKVAGDVVTQEPVEIDQDFLESTNSENISVDVEKVENFGGKEESAQAFFNGSYQRTFDRDTRLTLVEKKINQAQVRAPEPSTTVALFLTFGLTAIGCAVKSKSNQLKSNNSQ